MLLTALEVIKISHGISAIDLTSLKVINDGNDMFEKVFFLIRQREKLCFSRKPDSIWGQRILMLLIFLLPFDWNRSGKKIYELKVDWTTFEFRVLSVFMR